MKLPGQINHVIEKFTQEQLSSNFAYRGVKYAICSPFIGIRGTFPTERKNRLTGVNLPFHYALDHSNPDYWITSVNLPNFLALRLFYGDIEITLEKTGFTTTIQYDFHLESNLLVMTLFIRQKKKLVAKATISRFLTDGGRVICQHCFFRSFTEIPVTVVSFVDQDIWEQEGNHWQEIKQTKCPAKLLDQTESLNFTLTDTEGEVVTIDHHLLVNLKTVKSISLNECSSTTALENDGRSYCYKGLDVELSTLTSVNCQTPSLDFISLKKVLRKLRQKPELPSSIPQISLQSTDSLDVTLQAYSQHLLDVFISPHSFPFSPPARGVSSQSYKGAIFWDSEIFMFPYYLYHSPLTAKLMLLYRLQGLNQAKLKATSYGYPGAFYAWESVRDGFDATSDYNITDALTGEKVRTYFKDRQIHINGAIVKALADYWDATLDPKTWSDLATMLLPICEFYLAWITKKDGKVSVDDVLGPDEYHERVNNDYYTNKIIAFSLRFTLEHQSCHPDPENPLFSQITKVLPLIPLPSTSSGLIPQFDGYLEKEDVSLETVLGRKNHPNQYLGGSGPAGQTQIIKQADVICALALFADDYDLETTKLNYEYYLPRTEHGSSLSASMYGLVASRIGQTQAVYDFWRKSVEIDYLGTGKEYIGGIYLGGTHLASAGGAQLLLTQGFTGLRCHDGIVTVENHLPPSIQAIKYTIVYRGDEYHITVNQEVCQVQKGSRL